VGQLRRQYQWQTISTNPNRYYGQDFGHNAHTISPQVPHSSLTLRECLAVNLGVGVSLRTIRRKLRCPSFGRSS
jgi:hypothetical protein